MGSRPIVAPTAPAPALTAPAPVPTARPIRILSLATATRDYARRLDAGTFASARASDLAPLHQAMGPAIWGWQYARRLTDQSPWRARPAEDERRERAVVAREMVRDIQTWERALARLDAIAARARDLGDPPPEPLAVPDEVRDAIAERRRAALARAARSRRRDDGGGPEPIPDEGVRHVPLPAKPV